MIDVLQTMSLHPEVQPGLEARYRVHGPDAPEAVKATIRGLVTNGHVGASRELIDSLPRLEVIVSSSVGYDHIDVEYARSKGIPVTNTAGSLDDDVADLAIALMIMTARRLVPSDRYVRDNRWTREGDYPLQHRASGKRVGILGLGRIGKAIARRAEAMDNTIAYHSRREVAGSPYKYYPSLLELAKNSDFLVIVIPASAESHKIVGKDVIEALGPSGILVNVARGTVVDEEAMIAALQAGRLGGAGLDVFYDEPRVPEVFFGMENVVLMPHVGSATVETRRAMSQLTLDNLDAHFAGKKLLTPI